MEGGNGILLDSEPCGGGGGEKTKRGKMAMGDSVGGAQKKMLADITNLQQQRLKPLSQQAMQQCAPLAADNTADQLLKENAMLMKLLASRNAIIESCKAELQKSQSNFQKLRKQNSELAQTNSHMLAELNSSRQRLRELQHELGSKNGILKAMKLELTAKEHTEKLKHEIDANEVGASQGKQSDQTFQEDNREENLCHAKRRRVSKSQSSAPAVIKLVKSTEKVDNQRYCLRRQSTGLKAEKPGPTEKSFEVDEIKYDVSHLQENLANKNGPTSLGATVQEEAREDTESLGPTNTEQVHAEKNIEKKRIICRHSMRRQSTRFKPENPEPTEDFFEINDVKFATTTEQVHAKENIKKKRIICRHSLRRQSARFKPENPEPTEDFFEIDDANFNISHLCDNSEKSGPITSSVTSGQGNEEKNACKFDPQEIRRSSVGRPLRRTVEKVLSYKEVPLKMKMRRPD